MAYIGFYWHKERVSANMMQHPVDFRDWNECVKALDVYPGRHVEAAILRLPENLPTYSRSTAFHHRDAGTPQFGWSHQACQSDIPRGMPCHRNAALTH